MMNVQLIQIETLDNIMKNINSGKLEVAKDMIQQFRKQLQDEVDQVAEEGQKDWADNYVSADTGPMSDICDRIEEDIKNITKQNDK